MKPFILIAKPGMPEENIKPSIQISYALKHYATIWNDGQITFNPEMDYYLEEIEHFASIGKLFYTFYNNLAQ